MLFNFGFTSLVGVLFACAPLVSLMLVKRSRKRFDNWFRQGARAYENRCATDAWSIECAYAWKTETLRLAGAGELSALQCTQARRLLDDFPESDAPYSHDAHEGQRCGGAKVIICGAFGAAVGQLLLFATLPLGPLAICSTITALALCLALTDMAARIIPNMLVATLSITGIALRIACNQHEDLVALLALAALAIGAASVVNALHSRRHPNDIAIGGGDVKSFLPLVLCSGATGLLPACVAMLLGVAAHALVSRFALNQTGKLPLGPSIAVALAIGALASAL